MGVHIEPIEATINICSQFEGHGILFRDCTEQQYGAMVLNTCDSSCRTSQHCTPQGGTQEPRIVWS